MNNIQVGKIGESKAVAYLVKNKYKILALNYRDKIGEIDIIASIKSTLVFVEVKTRNTNQFGTGRQSVTKDKQNKIKLVAKSFMQKNQLSEVQCRFDVIEVFLDKVEHLTNAF